MYDYIPIKKKTCVGVFTTPVFLRPPIGINTFNGTFEFG